MIKTGSKGGIDADILRDEQALRDVWGRISYAGNRRPDPTDSNDVPGDERDDQPGDLEADARLF